MNQITKKVYVALLICSVGTVSYGQETLSSTYVCTIKEAKDLSEDGLLSTHQFNENSEGKTFFVDRNTGLSIGEFKNYVEPSDVEVISRGSAENSFVAVGFVGPFKYLTHIEIEEWRDSLDKPFLAIDYIRGILTGLCRGR